jgi:hypothetical protein
MYLATKVDEEVFVCLDLIGEKCRNLKKLDLWVDVEGSVELNGLKIGDGNDELGYMAGNSLVYTGDSIRMII